MLFNSVTPGLYRDPRVPLSPSTAFRIRVVAMIVTFIRVSVILCLWCGNFYRTVPWRERLI